MSTKFYLIEEDILPTVFRKTLEAKKLLETGQVKTVADAADRVGISRSAFYMYKDSIRPFVSFGSERIVTINIVADDRPGVLSGLLNILHEKGANILTINQSLPSGATAVITISFTSGNPELDPSHLVELLRSSDGVIKVHVTAG